MRRIRFRVEGLNHGFDSLASRVRLTDIRYSATRSGACRWRRGSRSLHGRGRRHARCGFDHGVLRRVRCMQWCPLSRAVSLPPVAAANSSPAPVVFEATSFAVTVLASRDAFATCATPVTACRSYSLCICRLRSASSTLVRQTNRDALRAARLAIDRIVTAPHRRSVEIEALRAFNALLYAAAIATLRGLGVPRRLLVAVALNPR